MPRQYAPGSLSSENGGCCPGLESVRHTMDIPSFKEDHISQVPALELLQKLGYEYISPAEAVERRGGRLSQVVLESVLAEQLRKINTIRFKGREYPFSEG